jgi:hypothetical protein
MRPIIARLVLVLLVAPLGVALLPAASARPVWTPPRQLDASGSQAATASNEAGDSVAVWVGRDSSFVYASFRVDGGGWDAPAVVSDPVIHVGSPQVTLDESGRATVAWSSFDGGPMGSFGSFEDLLTAQGRPGRPWSSPQRVAGSIYGHSVPVVDATGRVSVAWLSFHGCVDSDVVPCTPEQTAAGRTHVNVSSRTATGAWGASVDLGEGDSPALAAGPDGSLSVVWLARPARHSEAGAVTAATRSVAGAWRDPTTLASGDGWAAAPELVVDDDGMVTAGWAVCDGASPSQSCHQQAASRSRAGGWAPASTLPERIAGESSRSAVDLALDGSGRVTALWWEGSLVASTRTATGWGPLQDVTGNGAGIRDPDLAADRAGDLVATWIRTSSSGRTSTVRAAYRPVAGDWQPTTVLGQAAVVSDPYRRPVAKVVAAGRRFTVLHDGGGVVVTDRVDDRTAPVARMRGAYAGALTRARARVSWIARDTDAGVDRVQVRRRTASYRSSFGGWSYLRKNASTASATMAGRPGRTYCLSVRARDRAGNWSAWSRGKCVSTPVDDRALRATDGWHRMRSAATSYRRTETRATRRGAQLRLTGVRGRRLYVVATTCPRCGTVAVRLGGQRPATVSLRSGTLRHRRLLPVRSFSRTRSGTLTLRVTSAGRPVSIDGVVAAQ